MRGQRVGFQEMVLSLFEFFLTVTDNCFSHTGVEIKPHQKVLWHPKLSLKG